tara:strand:- start:1114 stop:1719 length:606 start_codon:yes stop_codon:yes gene_type:complete
MIKKKLLMTSNDNPYLIFKDWYQEACRKEINDPNAMTLSTISKSCKPTSRIVLLKDYDHEGFVFYTNKNSKKGNSIKLNPNVALNFHWKSMLKQVRVEGKVTEVSKLEADKYFDSRAVNSRIGAWASDQSSKLKNRKKLLENINYYSKKFNKTKIPRPSYWTGFKVKPTLIEFWQDMPFRLHDRIEFKKVGRKWITKKLFP